VRRIVSLRRDENRGSNRRRCAKYGARRHVATRDSIASNHAHNRGRAAGSRSEKPL